jgi:hypothetical protein
VHKETNMRDFHFLRRVLAIDGITTAAFGLALAAGAGVAAPLLGYSEAFIRTVGIALLPVAAMVTWMASRPVPPAPLVWGLIAANCLWVAESLVLLGQFSLTPLGVAFTLAQAAFVAAMGVLEFAGMRRAPAAS